MYYTLHYRLYGDRMASIRMKNVKQISENKFDMTNAVYDRTEYIGFDKHTALDWKCLKLTEKRKQKLFKEKIIEIK